MIAFPKACKIFLIFLFFSFLIFFVFILFFYFFSLSFFKSFLFKTDDLFWISWAVFILFVIQEIMSSLVQIQKQLLAVVLQNIFFKISLKSRVPEVLQLYQTFHNCFSVNFAKVLRTHFSFFTEYYRRTDSVTVFLLFVCTLLMHFCTFLNTFYVP